MHEILDAIAKVIEYYKDGLVSKEELKNELILLASKMDWTDDGMR